MSKIIKDPALDNRTTSLRHSGPVWSDRVHDSQRKFVRQLSLLADNGNSRIELEAIGAWLIGQDPIRGEKNWSFSLADTRIVGPGQWGYISFGPGTTPHAIPGDSIVVASTGEDLPLVMEDGDVFVIPAGGISPDDVIMGALVVNHNGSDYVLLMDNGFAIALDTILSEPATVVISQETAWFLRAPAGFEPIALETAKGDLLEGSGFRVVNGWIVLRDNPWDLWPNGVAHATASRWRSACPRHRALRTDRMRGSGYHVAAYKRRSQSVSMFGKAIAEMAGIPVFDNDGVVSRIFQSPVGWVHHLTDGTRFILPANGGYQVGSQVFAGTIGGDLVSVRSLQTHGEDWWRARPWGEVGIDISVFRPGFTGFRIRDEALVAISYEDEDGGLRARVQFGQDPTEESRYWAWQAKTERLSGVETFARDVLGFTAPGQSTQINPMEIWARMMGSYLIVIESPIHRYDSGIFREMRDFIDREKPAGTIAALLAI